MHLPMIINYDIYKTTSIFRNIVFHSARWWGQITGYPLPPLLVNMQVYLLGIEWMDWIAHCYELANRFFKNLAHDL